MIRATLLVAILLAGCARVPVRITDLAQGLMRKESGAWRIYETGETFTYRENGECSVAGKPSMCMWRGIEFNFAASTDTTILDCVARMNTPTNVVNYKEERATSVLENRFTIEISGRTGHKSLPGYTVLRPEAQGEQSTHVECSHHGVVVLRYGFILHPN